MAIAINEHISDFDEHNINNYLGGAVNVWKSFRRSKKLNGDI